MLLPNGASLSESEMAFAADDVELAQAVGAWTSGRVIEDASRWHHRGPTFARIAINACAAEFRSGDFAERFIASVRGAGLPLNLFDLEVAETVLTGRAASCAVAALTTLSEAGVNLTLDEFGRGAGSLSNLRRLPIRCIKIDGSFITAFADDPSEVAMVRAIIGLANGFGIGVSADGIATAGQASALSTLGCRIGQGEFCGLAEPAARIAVRLGQLARRNSSGG